MEIVKNKLNDFFTINNDKKIASYSLLAIFIVGTLAYNLLLVYGFANPDGINEGFYYYIAADWASEGCGRWLIRFFNLAHSNIVIPVITLVEYCLCIWVSTIVTVKTLDIRKNISVIAVSVLFIVLPGVITQFTYTFTAGAYGFSCMLSTLFVYFCLKDKVKCYLLAALMLCCSMALYQSYIGYAAVLMLMALIIKTVKEKNDLKEIFNLFIKAIIAALLGAGLYFAIYKIDLMIFGLDTVERVNDFSLLAIIKSFPEKFIEMYRVYFSLFSDGLIKRDYLYIVLSVGILFVVILNIIRLFKEKEYTRIIILIIGIILIPPVSELIGIIIPFNKVSNMMSCQNYLIFPFVLSLIETEKTRIEKYVSTAISLLLIILAWTYVLSANATFRAYQISYNHLNNEMNNVVGDIYKLDDYRKNETVIMLGGFPDDSIARENIQVYRYAIDFPENVAFWEDMTGATTNRYWYFMNMFGIDTGTFTNDDYYAVMTGDEYASMPVWPSKGSVKMINGFAVVKFDEAVPLP